MQAQKKGCNLNSRPVLCFSDGIENLAKSLILFGTGRGNRTHMGLLPPDFESGASTNFAIPAETVSEISKPVLCRQSLILIVTHKNTV